MDFLPPFEVSQAQDETAELRPKFNADGLIPVIAQDAESGKVLMLAWMNAEALALTLSTAKATYWSRSRSKLWVKGETSGHTQTVVSATVDCDQDTILLQVTSAGPACHTHRTTCFYRQIDDNELLKFE